MKEQLRIWLNGDRDFRAGAALYCVLGDNIAIKALLKKGRTDYLQKRLEEELDLIYDELVPPTEGIAAASILPLPPAAEHLMTSAPRNPELEAASEKKATALYKQMMNERAVLFSLAKIEIYQDPNTPDLVEQRRKLALSVCDQNYQVSKAYEDLDHIRKYGVLPVDPVQPQTEIEQVAEHLLKHTINNLRKNLSKMRKRELTPERITLIQQHEKQLQALLDSWEKLNA